MGLMSTRSWTPERRPSPALRELASLYSIQTVYTNVFGNRIEAGAETIFGILRARGVALRSETDVMEAIALRRSAASGRVIEPVNVAWTGRECSLNLRLDPRTSRKKASLEIQLEDGGRQTLDLDLGRLAPLRRHRDPTSRQVIKAVPVGDLPPGYHRVRLELGGNEFRAAILSAPRRAWTPDPGSDRGAWGVFVPIYALHHRDGFGIGDFGDAETLAAYAGRHGASFVGTLPLLPAYLQEPFDPSPYSPVSRLFWNEIYIDLDRIPFIEACDPARRLLQPGGRTSRVSDEEREIDYRTTYERKREVLEALATWFFGNDVAEREAYESFIASRPYLRDYARFRAVVERRGEGWRAWPERLRRGDLRETDFDPAVERLHLFVQWIAAEQLAATASAAAEHGVRLYLDFPLGTHPDAFDVWRFPSLFADTASVGAPPDISYASGQNWGFPPLDPDAIREDGYSHLIDCVRHQMRHAGMLRIDHVMGLHRLYWIPEGMPPSAGAYVRYRARELYAIFNIESHRSRAQVIGEDLGTVPSYVRTKMDRRGFRRLFVLQRQMTHVLDDPPGEITPNMVASLNNHDMPPFTAFWNGNDIDERLELRMITSAKAESLRQRREAIQTTLTRILHERQVLRPGATDVLEVTRAAHRFLAGSRAGVVLLNLEDLWLETESQNIPTTTSERPNWRFRTRLTLEQIQRDELTGSELTEINRIRRQGADNDRRATRFSREQPREGSTTGDETER